MEKSCKKTDEPFHVLLVEDDDKLSGLIKAYLELNHFAVSIETRGDLAADRIVKENPDLVILDILLPGKNGRIICREVRPHYDGFIIMLTALNEDVDQILGLEVGADDYIAKPIQPRLLLSRIKAVVRRAVRTGNDDPKKSLPSHPSEKLSIGSIEIDAVNRSVLVKDRPEEFTADQFDLLCYMAQHAGRIISRDQLYKDLMGIEYDGFNRTIDLKIARLRGKIGDNGNNPKIIKSVRGKGYLMVKEL